MQYHESCYRSFTLVYNKSFIEASSTRISVQGEDKGETQEQGDYTAVKEFVTEHVLNGKHAVSMNTLQTIYNDIKHSLLYYLYTLVLRTKPFFNFYLRIDFKKTCGGPTE